MLDTGELDTGAEVSTVLKVEETGAEETGIEVGSVEKAKADEIVLDPTSLETGIEVESGFEKTEDCWVDEGILLKRPEKAELISERMSEAEEL